MARWFINPGKKKRKATVKARKRTTRKTAKRRRRLPGRTASGQFLSRKRKVKTVARKRRKARRTSAKRVVSRRRRVVRKSKIVRVRRRAGGRTQLVKRRSYKRNPGGMFGSIKQGLTDAAFVTLGQVGSNLIGRVIPTLPLPGMIGDGLKSVGAALVVGFVSSKALKGDQARMATAGAFAAALQSLIRKAGIPVLSTSFGDYEPGVGSYSSLGAYSAVQSLPGVGIGDIDAADADYADQMDQYEGY